MAIPNYADIKDTEHANFETSMVFFQKDYTKVRNAEKTVGKLTKRCKKNSEYYKNFIDTKNNLFTKWYNIAVQIANLQGKAKTDKDADSKAVREKEIQRLHKEATAARKKFEAWDKACGKKLSEAAAYSEKVTAVMSST